MNLEGARCVRLRAAGGCGPGRCRAVACRRRWRFRSSSGARSGPRRFDRAVAVGGEQCQDLLLAGVADQDDAAGLVAERAVPDAGDARRPHADRCAVAGHGGAAPLCGGGDLGGGAEPVALAPGAAAFAGARRRGRVQRGVGGQPGGDRGAGHQQRLAVVGGVPDGMHASVGKFLGQQQISSPASCTGDAVPLPRQSRNSTGRDTGWQQNGNSTTMLSDDPPVAAAQRVRVLRGAVMGPEHGVHLATPAAKQGVVDDDLDRRALGQQPGHDQPRQGEPEPIGVPAMRREESAARVERHDRRHPGRREHADHGAAGGLRHQPAGQQHEQREGRSRGETPGATPPVGHATWRVGSDPEASAEPRISVELSSNRRCFVMLTAGSRRHADHATNTSHTTRATQDKLRNSRLVWLL